MMKSRHHLMVLLSSDFPMTPFTSPFVTYIHFCDQQADDPSKSTMLALFSCQGDDDACSCMYFLVVNVERAMQTYSTRCLNMQTVLSFGQQVRIS